MDLPDCLPDSPLSDAPSVDVPTDQWITNAVASVDSAVSQLIVDFMAHPYTHRVEHSFHIQLWDLLVHEKPLRGRVRIGSEPFTTQLIHKEWPSDVKVALTSGAHVTRQRYDLGIFTPDSVRTATRDEFAAGLISAKIVIELGLDYSLPHLEGDVTKLTINKVPHPYLVHFSRKRTRQDLAIEAVITALPSRFKTAFVHLDVERRMFTFKRLDSDRFETAPYVFEEMYR